MPVAGERKRGVVKYRSKKLPNGQVIHFAVVRKGGPRGGHTVAGKPHDVKGRS